MISPKQPGRDRLISVFLLVHGTGSNFYAGGVLERFAQQAAEAGHHVLRINTRGHDLVTRIGRKNLGAAYETVSDCRSDLAAWIRLLAEEGFERIALAGHSMGAVKSIYAQALDQHSAVGHVIGISPPRFCHARLTENPAAAAFRVDFERATELVSQGMGEQLLSVRQPLPMLLTAEGFLAKYGPEDDYDYFKYLPKLNCPSLIVIGTASVEHSPAFAGVPGEFEQLLTRHPDLPVSFELIEGADTAYSKHTDEPFQSVQRWFDKRNSP